MSRGLVAVEQWSEGWSWTRYRVASSGTALLKELFAAMALKNLFKTEMCIEYVAGL